MRRSLLLAVAAALAACELPEHQNPFDPGTPPALQARATLEGHVTLEAEGPDAPAPEGVQVSLPTVGVVTTDEHGDWSLPQVPPGTWTIQFSRDRYVAQNMGGVVVTLDDGDEVVAVPLVVLALARGDLVGRVALEGETNAAGVTVSLSSGGATTTDLAGVYRLNGIPVGTYSVTASRVGFADATLPAVTIEPGETTSAADLFLAAVPGTLSGTVLVAAADDSAGVRVRAAGTTLSGSTWEQTTLTPASGAWTISGVPAGSYNVTFELEDYDVRLTAVTVPPGADVVVPPVSLTRQSGSVSGVALLENASDSSGIQVALTPEPTAGNPTPSPAGAAITDATGSWRVDGLPVGPYTLSYRKQPGYLAQSGAVTVVTQAVVQAAQVTLAAVPGVLQGQAYLEGASAGGHAGITVYIQGSTGITTTTSAAGAWQLTGVPAGARTVVFSRTGFDDAQVQAVIGPGDTLTLLPVTLAVSRGALTGTVVVTGAASAAGAVVTVTGPTTASTITGSGGGFALGGLPVGTYAVEARKDPAWQPVTLGGVVVSAGATTAIPSTFTLPLVTSGSLAGTVTVEAGTADGVTVSLTGTNVNGAAVTRSTTTAAGGGWSIGALPHGTYALGYSKSGYDPASAAGLVVASAAVTAPGVTLAVSRGAVAGTIAVSSSVGGFTVAGQRAGIQVQLSGCGVAVSPVVTDASGNFRFDDVPVTLPPGTPCTVTATKPFFRTATSSVTVAGNATATPAPAMTLALAAGSISGTARLWDNVNGTGANADSSGVPITVTGTAFDGSAWSAAATTGASGAWTVSPVPPGTYAVSASGGTSRTCEAYTPTTTVPPDGAATAVALSTAMPLYPAVRCVDADPPSAVQLGTPAVPSYAQAGYTNLGSVAVPITAATDGNLRGYQVLVGSAADWDAATLVPVAPVPPTSLTFTPLVANAANTLRVRALDWAGNAGPESSVVVVQDQALPVPPTMTTSRLIVNATTATVILTGSSADANFLRYETFVSTVAATATCPATPTGPTWASSPDAASVNLTADLNNCVFARALDRAGNASPASLQAILSDLTAPTPPTVQPTYDPAALTVNADDASFFVTTGSTDAPAGGATAWRNVAWLEVDAGSGFTPLCPGATCHDGAGYDPCSCACADARLLCSADTPSRFLGFKVPLRSGTLTTVAVRAVDLAGNVGSSVSQAVTTAGVGGIVTAGTGWEYAPHLRGNLVLWSGNFVDMGENRRYDPGLDPACAIGDTGYAGEQGAQIASATLIAYPGYSAGAYQVYVRRKPAGGAWCSGETPTSIRAVAAGFRLSAIAAGGERVAWVERRTTSPNDENVYVRDPGADGLLGTGDDPAPVAVFTAQATGSGRLSLAGRRLLVQRDPGTGERFSIVTANTAGFSAGRTTYDLPATIVAAALSADGEALATGAYDYVNATLSVRRPSSPGAAYGAGDLIVTRSYAASLSAWLWGLAIDGPHVVALDNVYGGGTGYVTDWFAGGDGVFEAASDPQADDSLARAAPSATPRHFPSVSNGLLVYQNNDAGLSEDVLWLDLTQVRWEAAAGGPLEWPRPNGQGAVVFQTESGLRARTATGGDASRTGGSLYGFLSGATGPYFLNAAGTLVQVFRADANGLWFTAAAEAAYPPVNVYDTGANQLDWLAAQDGKALVLMRSAGAGAVTPIVLEPSGAGGLRTPAAVNVLAGTGVSASQQGTWRALGAISGRYAAFPCAHSAFPAAQAALCLRTAGGTAANPVFSASDPASTVMLTRPAGSPGAGQPYTYYYDVRVSGERLAIVYGGEILIREPGADAVLGNADDVEYSLGTFWPFLGEFDLAGNYVVYLDAGGAGGKQVYLVDLAAGAARQPLTSHYSVKEHLAVEPSGRAYWKDSVFLNDAVFVRTP